MSPLLELLLSLRGSPIRLRFREQDDQDVQHHARSGLLLRVEIDHVVLRRSERDDTIPLYSIEGVEAAPVESVPGGR